MRYPISNTTGICRLLSVEDKILNRALLDAERFIGNAKYEEYQKEFVTCYFQDIYYNPTNKLCNEHFKYGTKGLIKATYYRMLLDYHNGVPFMNNIKHMIKVAYNTKTYDGKILVLVPLLDVIDHLKEELLNDHWYDKFNIVTVDGSLPLSVKRKALEDMKNVFQKNLSSIYEQTLTEQKWIGCDIWDFFSNKKVDNLCIKNGARNILVILTDGYLFAEGNKIKEDYAYSYILPQTLAIDNSSLIDRRNGDLKGKGLEVLFLEINPYQHSHRDKMEKVLEDWLNNMGVEKFVIAETDANLTNTQAIIKNFLEQ